MGLFWIDGWYCDSWLLWRVSEPSHISMSLPDWWLTLLFLTIAVNPSISQWDSTRLMADIVVLDYCGEYVIVHAVELKVICNYYLLLRPYIVTSLFYEAKGLAFYAYIFLCWCSVVSRRAGSNQKSRSTSPLPYWLRPWPIKAYGCSSIRVFCKDDQSRRSFLGSKPAQFFTIHPGVKVSMFSSKSDKTFMDLSFVHYGANNAGR
jgi:hypothetical protein